MSSVFPPSGSIKDSLLAGAAPGNGATWASQLRKASFGGVPFGVLGGQIRVGRRNAVHEYPKKDEVWVEDLGRAARRITLVGFLVENGAYAGGKSSVIAQRERLIAICESKGPSALVHPTLGSLIVSLVDTVMDERWDRGRVFEISFSFIESGVRTFPQVTADGPTVVKAAAQAAKSAVKADFVSSVTSTLKQGSSVVDMAVTTARKWAANAQALAVNATNLMNTVGALRGPYGRFFGGKTRGINGISRTIISSATTVERLIAVGTSARESVTKAASALVNAAKRIAS